MLWMPKTPHTKHCSQLNPEYYQLGQDDHSMEVRVIVLPIRQEVKDTKKKCKCNLTFHDIRGQMHWLLLQMDGIFFDVFMKEGYDN